jgi:hypothetical protein
MQVLVILRWARSVEPRCRACSSKGDGPQRLVLLSASLDMGGLRANSVFVEFAESLSNY